VPRRTVGQGDIQGARRQENGRRRQNLHTSKEMKNNNRGIQIDAQNKKNDNMKNNQ
jgi:hypothetical protein